MKCDFCGEETMNKVKGQPRCKAHVIAAKEARDIHNKAARKKYSSAEEYLAKPLIGFYSKKSLLDHTYRTTTGYHLNKMYQESEKKE